MVPSPMLPSSYRRAQQAPGDWATPGPSSSSRRGGDGVREFQPGQFNHALRLRRGGSGYFRERRSEPTTRQVVHTIRAARFGEQGDLRD